MRSGIRISGPSCSAREVGKVRVSVSESRDKYDVPCWLPGIISSSNGPVERGCGKFGNQDAWVEVPGSWLRNEGTPTFACEDGLDGHCSITFVVMEMIIRMEVVSCQ